MITMRITMNHWNRLICLFAALQMLFSMAIISAKEDWQRVYLATYPRSGNHWMRYLIEEATHMATGSVYRDHEPLHLKTPFPWGGYAAKNGYEGNCRYPTQKDIVVIKTHFPSKPKEKFDLKPTKGVIRIVRHPLDAFYSHFLHQKNELPVDGKIPSEYVSNAIKNWIKFEKFWDKQPDVTTIRYEDLYNDPYTYFKLIMTAIGYQVTEEDLNRALAKHPPRGGLMKHLNDYHPEDIEKVKIKLGPIMDKYGYKLRLDE